VYVEVDADVLSVVVVVVEEVVWCGVVVSETAIDQ
jgi:hypothetical protein